MKLIFSATVLLFSWAANSTPQHESSLQIHFNNVGELKLDADVLYLGNKIGHVEQIESLENNDSVVTLRLNKKFQLEQDSRLVGIASGSNSKSNSAALQLLHIPAKALGKVAEATKIKGFPSFSAFLNAK